MTFLPELKRLMEAATKGPWLVSHDGDYSLLYVDYPAQGIKLPLAEVYSNMQETDAKLIAYLVNHAPALAELVDAAEKVIEWTGNEQLREALAKLNANDAAAIRKLKVE